MSWVSPDDVINSWVGSNPPTDAPRLQLWIDRAERLVRRRVPDLQARIDAEMELIPLSSDLLETTKDVVAAMVTEVFKNPDGKRSIQSASGPLSESTTFGGENPGKLLIMPDQHDLLAGINPGEGFTVDLIGGHVAPLRTDLVGWL